SFQQYAHDLLAFGGLGPGKVSVLVPNFNYAHLLPGRIASIATQTHPIYELVVLDDASTDNSRLIAREELDKLPLATRFIPNTANSGSVFRQWLRGVEEAKGDFIWIAEADDLSDTDFLTEVMPAFADPAVVMSYCQSKQMAGDGRILCNDYLEYASEVSVERWRRPYVQDGSVEISEALAVKNTIPNVSAVVFRRDALLDVLRQNLEDITRFRIAGDWLAYTLLLERGKVAFSPRSLNLHRRHDTSVTLGSNRIRHLAEIIAMQKLVRQRHPSAGRAREQADSYAQKIYKQFGLASERFPHYQAHPDLAVSERALRSDSNL
ncbi:MAG: glycosyltransferase, partial [Ignavibacteriae bacterium]|nr:glycosyltransferase [Ignavibacteriota bacterium]